MVKRKLDAKKTQKEKFDKLLEALLKTPPIKNSEIIEMVRKQKELKKKKTN